MLESLFNWLYEMISAAPFYALTAAFVWGILSVVLSPCHLSGVPLMIAYISSDRSKSGKFAFYASLLFSLGILFSIALIGIITGLLGKILGDAGTWGNYLVAAIFFAVGLYMLDLIRIQLPVKNHFNFNKNSLWSALFLGMVFGLALGPCTFAFMAPVLAVALFQSSVSTVMGIMLLLLYGLGHCLVIIFAGTFFQSVRRYLNWNEKSGGILIMKKICGILIIAGGILLLSNKTIF